MRSLFVLLLLFPFVVYSQTPDLPPNPQPGKCYMRCKLGNGQTDWKAIDCELVKNYNNLPIAFNSTSDSLTEKDKKIIKRRLIKLLRKGHRLEIAVNYDSKASDSINAIRSLERAGVLAKYLVSQDVNPSLLWIRYYGNSQATKRCQENTDCTKIYISNSKIEYKVTGYIGEDLYYDEEKDIWCNKKDS